jgi:hypothetical protein
MAHWKEKPLSRAHEPSNLDSIQMSKVRMRRSHKRGLDYVCKQIACDHTKCARQLRRVSSFAPDILQTTVRVKPSTFGLDVL